MELEGILSAIRLPDEAAMQQAQRRWNSIAKPLGSLGLLEQAVVQIAGMTKDANYRISRRGVVIMCADNGVVAEGVTQTGSEITALVAENFTKGCSCVGQMARVAQADLFPVDIGMQCDVVADGLLNNKIAYGTQNIAQGPAMTRAEAIAAIRVGVDLVLALKNRGYHILATGEMGIGNTTTSSAVASVLLGEPVQRMTGRGAGLSSSALLHKVEVIEHAIAMNRPDPNDAVDVLAKVGGFDLAGLAGVFLGGAAARIPIIIDGFIASVAALVAARICPESVHYQLASHVSKEPGGSLVLQALDKQPLLTAGMCLGEGTGAVALLPILDMAYAVYDNMSTFQEIAMEDYQPLV